MSHVSVRLVGGHTCMFMVGTLAVLRPSVELTQTRQAGPGAICAQPCSRPNAFGKASRPARNMHNSLTDSSQQLAKSDRRHQHVEPHGPFATRNAVGILDTHQVALQSRPHPCGQAFARRLDIDGRRHARPISCISSAAPTVLARPGTPTKWFMHSVGGEWCVEHPVHQSRHATRSTCAKWKVEYMSSHFAGLAAKRTAALLPRRNSTV